MDGWHCRDFDHFVMPIGVCRKENYADLRLEDDGKSVALSNPKTKEYEVFLSCVSGHGCADQSEAKDRQTRTAGVPHKFDSRHPQNCEREQVA